MADQTWGSNVIASAGDAPSQNVRTYQVDCGALPASTSKDVAHEITGIDLTKVVRLYGISYSSSATNTVALPSCHDTAQVALSMDATNVTLTTNTDQSVYTATYVFIDVLQA